MIAAWHSMIAEVEASLSASMAELERHEALVDTASAAGVAERQSQAFLNRLEERMDVLTTSLDRAGRSAAAAGEELEAAEHDLRGCAVSAGGIRHRLTV